MQPRYKLPLLFMLFLSFFLVGASPTIRPIASDNLRDPVFVCDENDWRNCNQTFPSGQTASYVPYLEQVLANEWHASSDLEALKAGVVAIRTFADRNIGCGADTGYIYSPGAGIYFRTLYNGSQVFSPATGTVTNDHRSARSQTDGIQLYRADGGLACAKYDANTGNPTKACSSSDCPSSSDRDTLAETPDPVASNNYFSGRHSIGMSQNGSAAWSIGSDSWDYQQILSHYYRKVKIGASDDNDYRWVWLNVGDEIAFTGYPGAYYEEYYAPETSTPHTMGIGLSHSVRMHIQNTGDRTWYDSGSSRVRLSYHWYDSSGNNIIVWEGERTALGESISPGEDIVLYARVVPPSTLGTYVLKWDMVRGSGTWFSQQYSRPTQDVTVEVKYFNEKSFLPIVLKQ